MSDISFVSDWTSMSKQPVLLRTAEGRILDPTKADDLNEIAVHLTAPNAVRQMCQRGDRPIIGAEDVIIKMLSKMTPSQQVAVLSVPGAACSIMYSNQAAKEVTDMIWEMTPEQQATVLPIPGTVGNLNIFGQAHKVFHMIFAMTPEQQAKVLAGYYVVGGLIGNASGKHEQFIQMIDLIRSMTPEQQASAFSHNETMSCLRIYGKSADAIELVKGFSPDLQKRVISSWCSELVEILQTTGHEETIRAIRLSWMTNAAAQSGRTVDSVTAGAERPDNRLPADSIKRPSVR